MFSLDWYWITMQLSELVLDQTIKYECFSITRNESCVCQRHCNCPLNSHSCANEPSQHSVTAARTSHCQVLSVRQCHPREAGFNSSPKGPSPCRQGIKPGLMWQRKQGDIQWSRWKKRFNQKEKLDRELLSPWLWKCREKRAASWASSLWRDLLIGKAWKNIPLGPKRQEEVSSSFQLKGPY